MNTTVFEEKDHSPKNYFFGAIGALLLGTGLGTMRWAIGTNGYVVPILCFLIGFLSVRRYELRRYELLRGKTGRPKIGILCAAIFGIILGTILPDLIKIGQLIYQGEIEGATYSDIPLIYFYWVKNIEVFKSLLPNLGLVLFFGILGIIMSVFKTELKPNTPENPANDKNAALPANQDNNVIENFTVSYPKTNLLLFIVFINVLVFGVVFLASISLNNSVDADAKVPIAVICFYIIAGLIIEIILLLPLIFFHHYRVKRRGIEVNGNELKITPILGKVKTVYFNEITKVAVYPQADAFESSGFFSSICSIQAYSNNKRLFNVNKNCTGVKELAQRLKAENIPFSNALTWF
jgi:hypothetical protein